MMKISYSTMKIKRKAACIMLGVTLLITAITGYFNFASSVHLINGAKTRELQSVATLIEEYLHTQVNKASARASLVASIPSIQAAFRAHDREELIRRLLPAFLIQRDKFGVREAVFSLAPATSLLRLFALQTFGEDLSSFREMIVMTNTTGEPQRGVEIGRRGLSIRGMTVVKDDQGPIGSFEVGMNFSSILENVKKITGFEVGVFVDDELMSRIATAFPRPDKDRILGGFQNVESTDWGKIRPVVTGGLLTTVQHITYKIQSVGGVDYGTVLVPLLDFKGAPIGVIVASANFDAYLTQLQASLVTNMAFSLLQAIMLIGVVLIVFQALLMRPLAQISEQLCHLAAGETTVEMGTLIHTQDEVGLLAHNVERLKKLVGARQSSPGTQSSKE